MAQFDYKSLFGDGRDIDSTSKENTQFDYKSLFGEDGNLPTKAAERTWGEAGKDTAIQLGQGVVGLADDVVGLGNLATAGYLRKGIKAAGFDPDAGEKLVKSMGENLSDKQKQENQFASEGEGFTGTIKAYWDHPLAIAGGVMQSLPTALIPAGLGRLAVGKIVGGATKAALEGGATKAAAELAGREALKSTEAAVKIAWATHAGEGIQTAGSIANAALRKDEDSPENMYWGVPAGIATAVIGRLAGKVPGFGDAEAALISGAGGLKATGNFATRVGKSTIQEGVFQELPQSASEQAFKNLSTDRPVGEGVAEAAGQGLVVGGAMGGVHSSVGSLIHRDKGLTNSSATDVTNTVTQVQDQGPSQSQVFANNAFAEVGGNEAFTGKQQQDQGIVAYSLAGIKAHDGEQGLVSAIEHIASGDQAMAERLLSASENPQLINAGRTGLDAPGALMGYTEFNDGLRVSAGLAAPTQSANQATQSIGSPVVNTQQNQQGAEQVATAPNLNSAGYVPEPIQQLQAQVEAVREGRKPGAVIGMEEAQHVDVNGLAQGVAVGPDGKESLVVARDNETVQRTISRAAEVGLEQANGELLGVVDPTATTSTDGKAVVQHIDNNNGQVIHEEALSPEQVNSVRPTPGTTTRIAPVGQVLGDRIQAVNDQQAAGGQQSVPTQVAQQTPQVTQQTQSTSQEAPQQFFSRKKAPAVKPVTFAPTEQTGAAAALINNLNQGLGLTGDQAITPGSLTEVKPEKALTRMAAAIATAFGVKVVFVHAPAGLMRNNGTKFNDFNGVADRSSNTILMNVATNAPLNILGHELAHLLETAHPEIYQKLEMAVLSRMRHAAAKALNERLTTAMKAESGADANAMAREIRLEAVAEGIGEMAEDQALWADIFGHIGGDETLAKTLYKLLMDVIAKLQRALTNGGYITGIRDVATVKKAIVSAYQDWAKEYENKGGNTANMNPGEQEMFNQFNALENADAKTEAKTPTVSKAVVEKVAEPRPPKQGTSFKEDEAGVNFSRIRAAVPGETEISTRNPQGKTRAFDPISDMLSIDHAAVEEAMAANPKLKESIIDAILSYGFIAKDTPREEAVAVFKKNIVSNLLFLHDQVPKDIAKRSKLWYDGAYKIASELGKKYKLSLEQVAGITAAMSPQKDWFQNVSMAERAIDILSKRGQEKWSPDLLKYAKSYVMETQDRDEREKRQDAYDRAEQVGKAGTTLENMAPQDAAYFVRAWDEAFHSREYNIVTPEGGFGKQVKNDDGTNSTMMWSTFGPLVKTVSIFRDGSRNNISEQLGEEHKIRSFYNNIAAPNSKIQHVTIDTHAVAAALFEALAGVDAPVTHNFGGTGKSEPLGVGGTYGIIAQAYREAAAMRGVHARELQSITWEAVRGLFGSDIKNSIKPKVKAIWNQYRNGAVTFEKARDNVMKLAEDVNMVKGGIHPPDWVGTDAGHAVADGGTSYDQNFIPSGGVRLRPSSEIRDRASMNLSIATDSIPGLKELYTRSLAGETAATTLMQKVAGSSLAFLLSDTKARVKIEPVTGAYANNREPSLGVSVVYQESEGVRVLAALAKFADMYNQQQVHVRIETSRDVGHEFGDGSYATPVYSITLDGNATSESIQRILAETELPGFSVSDETFDKDGKSLNPAKLTTYWVQPTNGEDYDIAYSTYEKRVARVHEMVGRPGSKNGRSVGRLYVYGSGDGARVGYAGIAGNVRTKTEVDLKTPRLIAEYLNNSKVQTFKQKPLSKAVVKEQQTLAAVFEKLPVNNLHRVITRTAYEALNKALIEQYSVLPVKVELNDGIPKVSSANGIRTVRRIKNYKDSAAMRQDVSHKNRLIIYATTPDSFGPKGSDFSNHPLLKDSGLKDFNGKPMLFNDVLRAVHDYFAHNLSEVQFGPTGEYAAWENHMAATADPRARWALTAETRAQNAWQNFRPGIESTPVKDRPYATQKASLPPVQFTLTGDQAVDAPMIEFIKSLTADQRFGSLSPKSTIKLPKLDLGSPAVTAKPVSLSRVSSETQADQRSVGYHSGDLGYGRDTTLGKMAGGRSTGHFGTGVYFVGSPAKIPSLTRGDRPIRTVDLSKFNLAKPTSQSKAQSLHDGLKIVNRLVGSDVNSETAQRAIEEAAFNIWLSTGQKMSVEETQGIIKEAIQKATADRTDDVIFTSKYLDSASTRVMKKLGFEGIDVRGIPNFDTTEYGTVVYTQSMTDEAQPTTKELDQLSNTYDPAYSSMKTVGEAITHVAKNGGEFEKELVRRIYSSVATAPFRVVENGVAVPGGVPLSLNNARGVQWTHKAKGMDGVWVRGSSFAVDHQGANAQTVLHEAVHQATARKISFGNLKVSAGSKLNDAVSELFDLANHVIKQYKLAAADGKIDAELTKIAPSAFNDARELVSYGLTNPHVQSFLKSIPGINSRTSWSEFVSKVRSVLGMDAKHDSALSQLLDITDRVVEHELPDAAQSVESDMVSRGQARTSFARSPPIDSPAFQKAFGNTKVVDADGNARMVYTGTSKDTDFKSFKAPKNGIWFTYSAEEASGYAKENDSKDLKYDWETRRFREVNTADRVIPVYLNIENPKVYENFPDSIRLADNYKKAQGILWDQLKREGYDGVIVGDEVFVVFSPNQVKSAIGNNGNFDTKKKEINFARNPLKMESVNEALDLAQTGKVNYDLGDALDRSQFADAYVLAKNPAQRKSLLSKMGDKVIETFVDSKIKLKRWVEDLPMSPQLKQRLWGDMNRSDAIRASLEDDIKEKFATPMFAAITAVTNATKLSSDSVKKMAGYWMSARYSPEANARLISKDRTALLVAQATGDAKAIALAQDNLNERILDVNGAVGQAKKRGVAGGMNDAEAAEMVTRIEDTITRNLKPGSATAQTLLSSIAKPMYDMLDWKKTKDIASGKVTQTAVNSWLNSPNYVPLTGDPRADRETTDVFSAGGQVNQDKDHAMNGRKDSIADDGIDAAFESTIKSINFAALQDFKQTLNKVYLEAQARNQDIGLTREAVTGIMRTGDDLIIYRDTERHNNGMEFTKAQAFKFKDQRIMEAIKKDNMEQLNGLLKMFSTPTRWYARLVTQFMPMFAPVNLMRDIWERSELIRTRKLYTATGALVDTDKAARAAIAAVIDRDVWKASIQKSFKMGGMSPIRADLEEMIRLGGSSTTAGFLAKSSGDLEADIREDASKAGHLSNKVIHGVEAYNNMFEVIPSLAIYRALKDQGMEAKDAAAATLDLMNFRKKGTASPAMKALYIFSQPAAIGGYNLAKYLSTTKGKVRFATQTLIAAALYAMLQAVWGDDEDKELGNKLDNISNFTVERTIPIKLGDYVLKLPIGFGPPQLAWMGAVTLSRWASGRYQATDAIGELAKGWVKTMSAISPSDMEMSKHPVNFWVQSFTPTILKPLFNIYADQTSLGGPLTPVFKNPDKLRSEQAQRNTPPVFSEIARVMHESIGVDMYPDQIKAIADGVLVGPVNQIMDLYSTNPAKTARGEPIKLPLIAPVLDLINDRQQLNSIYSRVRGDIDQGHRELMSLKAQRDPEGKITPSMREQEQAFQRFKSAEIMLGLQRSALKKNLTLDPETRSEKIQQIEERADAMHRKLLVKYYSQ